MKIKQLKNQKIIGIIIIQVVGQVLISTSWLNPESIRAFYGNLFATLFFTIINLSNLFDHVKKK